MRHKYTFEVGDRYNKWTVIGYNKGSKTAIEVRCDCGTETWVQGWSLVNERSKQCKDCKSKDFGIRASNRRMDAQEALKSRVYSQCKSQAKRRKIPFDLTKEVVIYYAEKTCYYCKSGPSNTMRMAHVDGEFKYNGLDRFDSSQGYIVGNVLACCWKCNSMKSNMTFEEFMDHIKSITKRWSTVAAVNVGDLGWVNWDVANTLKVREDGTADTFND